MRDVTFIILALLLLALPVLASEHHQTYYPIDVVVPYPSMENAPQLPDNLPAFQPHQNELDEMVGEYVQIGTTWWESQHNGTVGRMIGFCPENEEGIPTVHMAWTRLIAEGGDRHIQYNRVLLNDADEWEEEVFQGYQVDAGPRSGYTTLAMDAVNNRAFPNYHSTTDLALPYDSYVATETDENGEFIEDLLPDHNGQEMIWPHCAYSYFEDTHYVHVVAHDHLVANTNPMEVTYSRSVYDPETGEFEMGDQQVVTNVGMNIGADVAASYDGSRIAIATTISQDFTIRGLETGSQYNNDIYVWVSDDGGETWDWDEPFNVTNFADVDDTLRAYTDCNVYFDHNNVLHVAFTAHPFVENVTSTMSLIYHWDEVSDAWTVVANGLFTNGANPGVWQRMAQRPSMYHDPDTGILYLVYQQFGVPGNEFDQNEAGYANAEIFITASPPHEQFYGRLWTKGINITDTQWDNPEPPRAGDCMNEREPSIALNNDGDDLFIMYVQDRDAGFVVQNEGVYTDNPVILHIVPKDELMDAIEDQAIWLENFALHIDSTQHWEDPLAYDWEEHGGSFFVDDLPPAMIDIPETEYDFGEVIIGEGGYWFVDINNVGDEDLIIHTATTTNDVFEPEIIDDFLIPAGEADIIEIGFYPDAETHYNGIIRLTTNDPIIPIVALQVQGDGVEGNILDIHLQANYFEMISTYLVPPDPDAMVLFGGVENLVIAYQNNGDIVIPPFINTIGDITQTQAYRLFCTEASNVQFTGELMDVNTEYTLLPNQWNWMGYPFDHGVDVADALVEIEDVTQIVMNDDGDIWIPPFLNTINDMQPGEGYFAFVTEEITFQYTDEALLLAAGEKYPEQVRLTPENEIQPTGLPYAVLVHIDSELQDQNSAIIEIYDGDLLVGRENVFEDSPFTPVIAWQGSEEYGLPGFTKGHAIRLKVLDNAGNELTLKKYRDFEDHFGKQPYASLSLESSTLPTSFEFGHAYPNPFNPSVTIPFALPKGGDVEFVLYDILGRTVFNTTHHYPAGQHRYLLDVSTGQYDLVSGVYFIGIEFNGDKKMQKLMLLK